MRKFWYFVLACLVTHQLYVHILCPNVGWVTRLNSGWWLFLGIVWIDQAIKMKAIRNQKFLNKLLHEEPVDFNQYFSNCHRCYRKWNIVIGHTTKFTDTDGCFPLCESCWTVLTPYERLPYYKQLYLDWERGDPNLDHKWEDIEQAVLAGK